jgi:hypothetical protein
MSPNIVIVGTLSEGDYKVTYPIRLSEDYHNEKGYQEACKKFYPAIDEADIVVVWGIPGHHTQRDINYAKSKGKNIVFLNRALDVGMEDRGENRVSTASPRSRRPGEEGKTKE